MAYDNHPNNNPLNNRDNNQVRNNQPLKESEDQRIRRQNRIGAIILGIAVLAFIGGYIATMDKNKTGIAATATTASSTTPATGTNEAAIAPAAGNATAPSTGSDSTSVNASPDIAGQNMAAANTPTSTATTTATSTPSTTQPVTANPKVYTSEESCRSIVSGACQPISGGWTPVNPAPEKSAVPEAVAPAMTATSPSDNSAD